MDAQDPIGDDLVSQARQRELEKLKESVDAPFPRRDSQTFRWLPTFPDLGQSQRRQLIDIAWATPCNGCRTPYRQYVREVRRLEAAGKRLGVDDIACCDGGSGSGASPRFNIAAHTVLTTLGIDPYTDPSTSPGAPHA